MFAPMHSKTKMRIETKQNQLFKGNKQKQK